MRLCGLWRARGRESGRTEHVVADQVCVVEALHRVVDAHGCCATSAASSTSEAASRGAASGRVGVCAWAASGVAASHVLSVSGCCTGEELVVGEEESRREMSSWGRRRRRPLCVSPHSHSLDELRELSKALRPTQSGADLAAPRCPRAPPSPPRPRRLEARLSLLPAPSTSCEVTAHLSRSSPSLAVPGTSSAGAPPSPTSSSRS